MTTTNSNRLASGAFTLPDASKLLRLPLPRLRTWVRGIGHDNERYLPAGSFDSKGESRDRHFGFYTLIEIFTIAELRRRGLSLRTLRDAREELRHRYQIAHPFALRGLLIDGKKLLKELGNKSLLELGSGGQASFEAVIKPFCQQLEFDSFSQLASRFFPMGSEAGVVVDPNHAFGRPVIEGTNIATETIASLIRGGESLENVSSLYELQVSQVEAAWNLEQRLAA